MSAWARFRERGKWRSFITELVAGRVVRCGAIHF
jgi:hypothetical protein